MMQHLSPAWTEKETVFDILDLTQRGKDMLLAKEKLIICVWLLKNGGEEMHALTS